MDLENAGAGYRFAGSGVLLVKERTTLIGAKLWVSQREEDELIINAIVAFGGIYSS